MLFYKRVTLYNCIQTTHFIIIPMHVEKFTQKYHVHHDSNNFLEDFSTAKYFMYTPPHSVLSKKYVYSGDVNSHVSVPVALEAFRPID